MGLYSFVDTTSQQPGSLSFPAEAMSINGVYIENQISGYRTLYTKGRELLGADVDSYQVGNTPGAYFRSKKLPSRTITVGYQLLGTSNSDFRTKFNNLNKLLNFEQAKLIFYDEQDKYFIGTKASVGEVPAGRNSVIGEFTILCADPYKYATTTKTAVFAAVTPTDGLPYLQATVANSGTVAVPIDYSITNTAENGFIGIVGTNAAMQYGYLEEADTAVGTMSQTIFNYETGAALAAVAATDINTYTEFGVNGTAEAYDATINSQTVSVMRLTGETQTSSGQKWQGAGRVISLANPAQDFVCTGRVWFQNSYTGTKISPIGLLDLSLIDENNNRFSRILVAKQSSQSIVTDATMYAGGQKAYNARFNATSDSGGGTKSKPNGAIIEISKSGGTFKFDFSGTKASISIPDLATTKCSKVVVSICFYAAGAVSNVTPVMYWKSLKFVQNNVDYEYDVPNRYQAGDVLTIVGSEAKAYKNGVPCIDDEIIGTEYFKAEPGNNTIQIVQSSWAQTQPTATATIREAWI